MIRKTSQGHQVVSKSGKLRIKGDDREYEEVIDQ